MAEQDPTTPAQPSSPADPAAEGFTGRPPIPFAAVIAALAAVACMLSPLWWAAYVWLGYPYVAALLIALGLAFSARWVSPAGGASQGWAVVALTVVGTAVGFVLVDQLAVAWRVNGQPVQPALGDSIGRMVRDIGWLLWTGLSAWIAFGIAARR